jgi:hypothetical protein
VRAVIYEAVPASLAAQGVAGLRDVLGGMHDIVRMPPAASGAPPRPGRVAGRVSGEGPAPSGTTAEREAELVAYTTRASDRLTSPDPGATLMRALTDEARLSLLVRTHQETLGALLTTLGRERTEALLQDFLAESPASLWTEAQGDAFSDWLAARAT